MVITQFYREREDGVKLLRRYSDKNLLLQSENGAFCIEAVDVENSEKSYREINIPIELYEQLNVDFNALIPSILNGNS